MFMKNLLRQPIFLGFLAVVAVAAVIFVATGVSVKPETVEGQEILASIDECLSDSKKNTCFKSLAEKWVEHDSVEAVFSLVEENEQSQTIFENCHVLFHFLGQAAYKKYGDVTETIRQGSPACFAGFYHGTLEGYFIENDLSAYTEADTAKLKEKIPTICLEEKALVHKDYLECLHGLGHAFMFATDGELPLALQLCDTLGEGEKASWCYSGAFMENSTSTTNPDHPSKYLKAEDPLYPCGILQDRYLSTCYILQSMHIVHKTNADWSAVATFCRQVPEPYSKDCFNGIGQSLSGFSTDPKVVRDICLSSLTDYIKECIDGVVGAMGEKYKSPFSLISDFCSVWSIGGKNMCYETAFNRMNSWSRDQKELRNFCETAAGSHLRESCLGRLK